MRVEGLGLGVLRFFGFRAKLSFGCLLRDESVSTVIR